MDILTKCIEMITADIAEQAAKRVIAWLQSEGVDMSKVSVPAPAQLGSHVADALGALLALKQVDTADGGSGKAVPVPEALRAELQALYRQAGGTRDF
jgi:hypothetical protein